MKVRKVNRYYCDFCKKSGCSAYHIRKHEERCTLNPNRKCGMCAMIDQEQPDINRLMILLPKAQFIEDENGAYFRSINLSNEFKDACGGCPACTMAAIRQSKLPVGAYSNFDFTSECKRVWNLINEERESHFQY